ncbi:MAG: lipid A biosynthesis [Deltaproteobacteria bacterium]|jgi:lipid-A-disaccharide synthase-like uncharacterized protein|nr:lipid A biosynthesis [Deltaproteobacteria bacterium]
MEGWNDSWFWLVFGGVGQAMFFARFLVQWVASERAGRSYVPVAFWYLSLVGAGMMLVYAVHREEPIFLVGQAVGWFVYARNLVLLRREGAPGTLSSANQAPPGPVD